MLIGGIFERDKNSEHRWLVAIGEREWIDDMFEWCSENLGLTGPGWFSMMHTEDGATFLELHFQSSEKYAIFEAEFKSYFLPNVFEHESDNGRSDKPAIGSKSEDHRPKIKASDELSWLQ